MHTEMPSPPREETGLTQVVRVTAAVVTLVAGLASVQFLEAGGRSGLSAGVLLLVVTLAGSAVALAGGRFGPEAEGPLDLSARIGLGVLAGVLAGLLHGALTEFSGALGLSAALGVGIEVDLSASQWGSRVLNGGVWGLVLGILYPVLPGAGFIRKGAVFSVLPTLYVLLVEYPVLVGAGLLGVRFGSLTFAFVLVGNAIAGVVAAAVIAWGGRSELAPLSRTLVG